MSCAKQECVDYVEFVRKIEEHEIDGWSYGIDNRFAWDGTDDLEPMFRAAAEPFGKMIRAHRVSVYVLTNYNTDMDWNLHRIYTLRDLGYDPYVMVYDKEHAPHEIRRLQRWCNNKIVFGKIKRFDDYDASK